MSTYTQSSQNFVRALKSPSDPPFSDGLHKIEIARQAWDDASFYVLNKGEVIADFILSRLLKDNAKSLEFNSVVDIRYWSLLNNILHAPASSQLARPYRVWLTPLLNRTPLAPILLSFFSFRQGLPETDARLVTQSVEQCLKIVWPLGVQKLSVDTLLDCFGAVLSAIKSCTMDESLTRVCVTISSSYCIALDRASNKKKLFSAFLQHHLQCWFSCLKELGSQPKDTVYQLLLEKIYESGVGTVFNIDVLRQPQDIRCEDVFFASLQRLMPDSSHLVSAALPHIFTSYVQYIRKYRVALFIQDAQRGTSSVEEVRDIGMRFFANCDSLLMKESQGAHMWSMRKALLAVVEKENLFHRASQELLTNSRELAISSIEVFARNAESSSTAQSAIDVLCYLARIDYDLIESSLVRILPKIITMTHAHDSCLAFLDLLLDYHTKTRTMDVYITSILAAVSDPTLSAFPDGPVAAYSYAYAGPLFSFHHLDKLSKAVFKFLTPGKCIKLATDVVQVLENGWKRLMSALSQASSNDGEGPRKKRRTIPAMSDGVDLDSVSLIFSLVARIAPVCLSSLPIQSIPESKREDLRSLLWRALNFSKSATEEANDFSDAIRDGSQWAYQVAVTAILRFRYVLNNSTYFRLHISFDATLNLSLLKLIHDDCVLPELVLEIIRSVLDDSVVDDAQSHTTIESILFYLGKLPTTSVVAWSGLSCHLTYGESGVQQAALAVLHLLVDRWLSVIDVICSRQQLERLMAFILDIHSQQSISSSASDLCASRILYDLMRSAWFWELTNLRSAFLSVINERTLILDDVSIEDMSQSDVALDRIKKAVAVYELLLFVPTEYYNRSSRMDLVRRAVLADIAICHLSGHTSDLTRSMHMLTSIRSFLSRTFSAIGTVEHSDIDNFLIHLMSSEFVINQIPATLASVTLDLIEMHLQALLRSQGKRVTQIATTVVPMLTRVAPFKQIPGKHEGDFVAKQSSIRLIRLLVGGSATSESSNQLRPSLDGLCRNLTDSLAPQMEQLVAPSTDLGQLADTKIVTAWSHVVSFSTWLHNTPPPHSMFGKALLSKLSQLSHLHSEFVESASFHALCSETMALLFEELLCGACFDRRAHLDHIGSMYVRFAAERHSAVQIQFDQHISFYCRRLSSEDFSSILETVLEGLTHANSESLRWGCIVRLASVLLREAPQGTTKIAQDFSAKCLNVFANVRFDTRSEDWSDSCYSSLEFTGQYCSERAATLRSQDMDNIWPLLSQLLSPSSTHYLNTSPLIFRHIVNVVGGLIRLRRDLVVHTLPQLGQIIQRLVMSIRTMRPQLGGKQSQLVTNSLPFWIHPAQPLGTDEGRILARLLTTLIVKTTPRTFPHTTLVSPARDFEKAEKAESLAKPFSKHAVYVLVAYIHVLNDPLCMLSVEMRRELEPGMFALCSMLAEYNRDALMVSALDAGGKTLMKTLWQEYEKQRYVGKG